MRIYTEKEVEIIKATNEFAKVHNIHYDELTETMIINAMREISKQINEEHEQKENEKKKVHHDIKDLVINEYEKGNIVVAGFEGIQAMPLKEFLKQPTDGILYDLNRNEAVVLTFIEDPKWINDYAVSKVIRELKRQIDELTNSK